jgi:zinc protease
MKMKTLYSLILTLFVTVQMTVAQQAKEAAKPGEVIELKMPKSGKTIIRLVFRNGSICDPAGKEGLTNITADMITQSGTSSMTSTQIREMTYPWSARMYSFTDKETVTIGFEIPTDYLDEFYTKVVRELLLHPSMDKNDFDRLLSNQKNYVEQVIRQSSDEEYGKKYLENVLFSGTPYSHLKEGTVASNSSITINDVKDHYKNFFRRDNVMLGIAGDYPASMVDKLKADINQLPATGPAVPKVTAPPMPDGLNVDIVSKQGALGSAISAGFPMNINRSNNEFAALMVANSWLGEHRKSYSRLYQKIREARSMNYGDYTYIEWYDNGGSNMLPQPGTPRSLNYFSIWLRPVQTAKGLKAQYQELSNIKIGHAHYALRMALREMDDLIQKGMTKEDFESTRDFLKSYSKLYIETPAKKLGYLMDSRFYGRTDWITELDGLLAKLTPEDVNNAMKKYWQTKNMEIVIVTDESEVANLVESLKNNSASPMSYSNSLKSSLPQTILDEDNVVSAYPLKVKNVRVVNSNDTFMK